MFSNYFFGVYIFCFKKKNNKHAIFHHNKRKLQLNCIITKRYTRLILLHVAYLLFHQNPLRKNHLGYSNYIIFYMPLFSIERWETLVLLILKSKLLNEI